MQVRAPAVAGTFYPEEARHLRAAVHACLSGPHRPGRPPKAIIAPHAGYEYSGPIAGSAYALVAAGRDTVSRVVLIGPSHRVAFRGLAIPSATHFRTPLGEVPIDHEATARLLARSRAQVLDAAHRQEHSLEVHLPFLQEVLGDFVLVPMVAGAASPADVGEALEEVWGGPETLVVVSSDLSHFHDYATARRLDAATSAAIAALQLEAIDDEDACGSVPVRGLLWVARRRGMQARVLDVRSSGDTAGPPDRVVGYGAYAFDEPGRAPAG